MDIVCRKTCCEFNDKTKCTRKHLSVNDKANCADIKLTKNEQEDISKDMFSKTPNIAPFAHCKCVDIKCECDACLFNKENECSANGIFVNSDENKAGCCTYIKS